MVHGGTTFGFWAGANCPPFSPQTTSYDYDAPVDEAGRATPKYQAIRALFAQHLQPGETLPDVPAPPCGIVTFPETALREAAPLFAALGTGRRDAAIKPMERYDQGQGAILYRTQLPAGEAGMLTVREAHDYAQLFLDGKRIGTIDRRGGKFGVKCPARAQPARLDILVEAMGRVNYGGSLHDRKGITEAVELDAGGAKRTLDGWEVFSLPFDAAWLGRLAFAPAEAGMPAAADGMPAVYRGQFEMAEAGDTFLDVRTWGKGNVWVNGHNLGRYWNIGPQQTMYVPGCWVKKGRNEILVLDVDGGVGKPVVQGLAKPILDEVRAEAGGVSKHRKPGQTLALGGIAPVQAGSFAQGAQAQVVRFAAPVAGRYFCLESLDSHESDPYASCAELYLSGADGKDLPRTGWSVAYADSEETGSEDGSADNVFDLQPTTIWHTEWQAASPPHPHQLVLDLGREETVAGFRYLPRASQAKSTPGRIKDYRVYVRPGPFPGLQP